MIAVSVSLIVVVIVVSMIVFLVVSMVVVVVSMIAFLVPSIVAVVVLISNTAIMENTTRITMATTRQGKRKLQQPTTERHFW
jgi:ABC-type siderophore export system fused ATPase/permease subunit